MKFVIRGFVFVALIIFSHQALSAQSLGSTVLAADCSPLKTCSGEKWIKDALTGWAKSEDGLAVNLSQDKKLCRGAAYPSIGVKFSDGTKFIADPQGSNILQAAILGCKTLLQGRFYSSQGETLGTIETSLNSRMLSGSVTLNAQYYQVVCK